MKNFSGDELLKFWHQSFGFRWVTAAEALAYCQAHSERTSRGLEYHLVRLMSKKIYQRPAIALGWQLRWVVGNEWPDAYGMERKWRSHDRVWQYRVIKQQAKELKK